MRFRKNSRARWALRFLGFLLFVALFADVLAGDKPLYCQLDGKTYFPVFQDFGVKRGFRSWPAELAQADWYRLQYDRAIWPLIPYDATTIDPSNMGYRSPFGQQRIPSWQFRHWLGTDKIGRDVTAGLIAGARTALWVGCIAMSIAVLLGITLGLIAGYYGDYNFSRSRAWLFLFLLALPLSLFWAFVSRRGAYYDGNTSWEFLKSTGIVLLTVGVARLLVIPLQRIPILRKEIRIPVDLLIMRLVEIFQSIPTLLLLLASVAVIPKPNIYNAMFIIGLLSWPAIARFVRSETLRIRNLEYVDAAKALGYSDFRIIFRHVLPNTLTPVFITVAFGFAGAILLEAFLSFLGVGLSPDQVTWGSLLQLSRSNFSAWWLAIFPGLAIFSTVLSFNLVGEGLSEALNPDR